MPLPFMIAAAKAAGSFAAWVSGTGAAAASHLADPALESAASTGGEVTMALAEVVGRVGVAVGATHMHHPSLFEVCYMKTYMTTPEDSLQSA